MELIRPPIADLKLGLKVGTTEGWARAGRVRHVVLPSGEVRFRPGDLAAMLRVVKPREVSA